MTILIRYLYSVLLIASFGLLSAYSAQAADQSARDSMPRQVKIPSASFSYDGGVVTVPDLTNCNPQPTANYTFEQDTAGWSITDPSARVIQSTTAYTGSHALVATGRTQSYYGPSIALTNLSADTSYVVTGWLRSSSAIAHSIMLKVGSTSPVYRSLMRITPTANTWTRFTAFLRLSSADIAKPLLLYVNTDSGTQDILLDDIQITPPSAGCLATAATQVIASDFVRVDAGRLVQGSNKTPLRLKGINVVAYDDDDSTAETLLTQAWWNFDRQDFKNIKAMGFTTIRLALWYKFFETRFMKWGAHSFCALSLPLDGLE